LLISCDIIEYYRRNANPRQPSAIYKIAIYGKIACCASIILLSQLDMIGNRNNTRWIIY